MTTKTVLQNLSKLDGGKIDLAIKDRKITQITNAYQASGHQIINCRDIFVSSGWIDLHAHAFPSFKPYGDEVDEIGYKLGVTTVVDAGSCGANNIHELQRIKENSKTNLFSFINVSKIGLVRTDELSDLSWLNGQKIKEAILEYPQLIVGLKARISRSVVKDQGILPLQSARKIADDLDLSIMAHIGSGPPDIRQILPYLKSHDIITHYLNGKENNLFPDNNGPIPELRDAIARGVHLDVGHGTASFSFEVAEMAKKNKIIFDTISTDIYQNNRLNGPVYDMATTLTKFLTLGYSLKEVIDAVTIHAARWLKKPELAQIEIGQTANLTLFKIINKETSLIDSYGNIKKTKQVIQPMGVVMNGEVILF